MHMVFSIGTFLLCWLSALPAVIILSLTLWLSDDFWCSVTCYRCWETAGWHLWVSLTCDLERSWFCVWWFLLFSLLMWGRSLFQTEILWTVNGVVSHRFVGRTLTAYTNTWSMPRIYNHQLASVQPHPASWVGGTKWGSNSDLKI